VTLAEKLNVLDELVQSAELAVQKDLLIAALKVLEFARGLMESIKYDLREQSAPAPVIEAAQKAFIRNAFEEWSKEFQGSNASFINGATSFRDFLVEAMKA